MSEATRSLRMLRWHPDVFSDWGTQTTRDMLKWKPSNKKKKKSHKLYFLYWNKMAILWNRMHQNVQGNFFFFFFGREFLKIKIWDDEAAFQLWQLLQKIIWAPLLHGDECDDKYNRSAF